MEVVLLVISVFLITIVLLQSGKAEGAGNIMGGNAELFAQRKERGFELFLSRLTLILGIIFFVICLVMSLID